MSKKITKYSNKFKVKLVLVSSAASKKYFLGDIPDALHKILDTTDLLLISYKQLYVNCNGKIRHKCEVKMYR